MHKKRAESRLTAFRPWFGLLSLLAVGDRRTVNDLPDAVGRKEILSCELLNGDAFSVLLTDSVIALGIFLLCAASDAPLGLVRLCRDVKQLAVDVLLNFLYKFTGQNIPCVLVRHLRALLSSCISRGGRLYDLRETAQLADRSPTYDRSFRCPVLCRNHLIIRHLKTSSFRYVFAVPVKTAYTLYTNKIKKSIENLNIIKHSGNFFQRNYSEKISEFLLTIT